MKSKENEMTTTIITLCWVDYIFINKTHQILSSRSNQLKRGNKQDRKTSHSSGGHIKLEESWGEINRKMWRSKRRSCTEIIIV